MERLFNPESPAFQRIQAEWNETTTQELGRVLKALESLRSQAPDVPYKSYGVCGNVRYIAVECPDEEGVSSAVGAYEILEYIGWHWPDALRWEDDLDDGQPTGYFCCGTLEEASCIDTVMWAGSGLTRRLQFIEFAINFLKEKIDVAV